jgi:hypothetical protein
MVETCHKTRPYRIASADENDRNLIARILDRERGSITAACKNNCYVTAREISRQCGQSVDLTLCPALFDDHVVAIDKTVFFQAFPKCAYKRRITTGASTIEKPHHRHRRLLRPRDERPSYCCPAQERD